MLEKCFFSNQQGPMAFSSRNSYHKPLVIFCEALKLPFIPQSHPLPQNAQLPELQCKTRKKFPKTAHSHAKMAHFHTRREWFGKAGKQWKSGRWSAEATAIGLVQIGPLRVANCGPRPPKKKKTKTKTKLPPQSMFTIIQMQEGADENGGRWWNAGQKGACLVSVFRLILLIASRKNASDPHD